jgi:ribosomal protein S18 acetylase RimI-like enzyme
MSGHAGEPDIVSVSERLVTAVRPWLKSRGAAALVVDDLEINDLPWLGWSGSSSHLRAVRHALDRVAAGEVEYLAVRAPSGEPIAKAGIDFQKRGDAGTLWQLATHPRLRRLGLGTRLIHEAENRIRARGRLWGALAVEDNNPEARALYERLDYQAHGQEPASWEHEDHDGRLVLYETTVTLLHKRL